MNSLSILAVQNAPLLRALATDPNTAKAELATAVGKDRSNLNRSIAALAEAGLLAGTDDGQRELTDDGRAQMAAIDRAEGRGDDKRGSSASGMLALFHAQILPDPANARRDWDSDEAKCDLDGLREDLLMNGLLQNLVVRPVPANDLQGVSIERTDERGVVTTLPLSRLVGGERRWRAIAAAIRDGDWPENRLIPCRELEADDLGCRLAALAENIQRRNLNPIEKARAFEGLAEAGLTNQQIAERIVATPEHVQQHRRFLQLDEADQTRMTLPKDDPRHLTVRDARQKLARKEESTPEPLDLTPLQRLVGAELVHAVAARATYTYNDIAVSADARETPEGQALAEAGIANFGEALREYGDLGGHFTVRLHYNNPAFDLLPWALAGDPADRDAGLKAEYDAFGGYDGQGYSTAWLNPPQELTPEGQIIRDRLDAQTRANEEAAAQRDADEAARKTRWAAARQRHIELFAEAATKPVWGVPEQTVEIAAAIDRPLPWAVTEAGKVFDANGKEVATFGYWQGCSDQGLVTARMIVAAVNAAGGLATPATAASPATPDDEEPEQDIDGNDPDADSDPEELEADAETAGESAA